MGTGNDSRALILALTAALFLAGIVIGILTIMVVVTPEPIPTPPITIEAQAAPAAPEPRLLVVDPPQPPSRTEVVLESQMMRSITASKVLPHITPIVLEPAYGE